MADELVLARRRHGLDLGLALGLNLIPVFGVLFWGWSAFALILIYWLENVAIGGRTLCAMAVSALSQNMALVFLGVGAFFTVHYGLFCAVHGAFVMSMFGGDTLAGIQIEPFNLLACVSAAFAAFPNLWVGFASVALWQVGVLIWFIASGRAREAQIVKLMFEPYPRIVILHLVILVSGGVVMALGQPVWAVALLGLMKAAFEIGWLRFGSQQRARGLDHPERLVP